MSLLDNMPHTVRHERNTYTRDEQGAETEAPEIITAAVEAWVQNATRSEITEFEKRDERVTHKVFFNADQDLRPGDYLVVTAGPSHVGERLKFQAYSDRSAGLGVLFGAMCELETNERYATFS